MKLTYRPKADFMLSASIEQLYVISEHWKKDLEFYDHEAAFLKNLLNKYYIWLTNDTTINKVSKISAEFTTVVNRIKNIKIGIQLHMKKLSSIIENPFPHDEQAVRDEHERLEDDFAALLKEYKFLKKNIFLITEKSLEEDQLQHIFKR